MEVNRKTAIKIAIDATEQALMPVGKFTTLRLPYKFRVGDDIFEVSYSMENDTFFFVKEGEVIFEKSRGKFIIALANIIEKVLIDLETVY